LLYFCLSTTDIAPLSLIADSDKKYVLEKIAHGYSYPNALSLLTFLPPDTQEIFSQRFEKDVLFVRPNKSCRFHSTLKEEKKDAAENLANILNQTPLYKVKRAFYSYPETLDEKAFMILIQGHKAELMTVFERNPHIEQILCRTKTSDEQKYYRFITRSFFAQNNAPLSNSPNPLMTAPDPSRL